MESRNYFLPLDIILKIILLLPFRFLLTCKLLSKQFNTNIKDSSFLRSFRDPSLAFFYRDRSIYSVTRQNYLHNRITATPPFIIHRLPIDIPPSGIHKHLSDPSKGLVCFVTNCGILIFYNIFSGHYYQTSNIPLFLFMNTITTPSYITDEPFGIACPDLASIWLCYGFGYDHVAHDATFMLVFRRTPEWTIRLLERGIDINKFQNKANTLYWVYTLKTRVWKVLEGFPFSTYTGYSHRYCSSNGVLHWVVSTRGNGQVILTYDLHKSRFGELSIPVANCGLDEVGELGGHLCAWSLDRCSHIYTVWKMREYGVGESWTIMLKIDSLRLSSSSPYVLMCMGPVMVSECEGGRRLMLFIYRGHTDTLRWYDLSNEKVIRIPQSVWMKRMKPSSPDAATPSITDYPPSPPPSPHSICNPALPKFLLSSRRSIPSILILISFNLLSNANLRSLISTAPNPSTHSNRIA